MTTPATIKSYGERYIADHGIDAARVRVAQLKRKAWEPTRYEYVVSLIQEYENLERAIARANK